MHMVNRSESEKFESQAEPSEYHPSLATSLAYTTTDTRVASRNHTISKHAHRQDGYESSMIRLRTRRDRRVRKTDQNKLE